MFLTKLIRSLLFSFIRDVKSAIGTLAIILFLYLGFFGSKAFNIKPFILDWLSKSNTKELIKSEVGKQIDEY